jgi:hypothetical protein
MLGTQDALLDPVLLITSSHQFSHVHKLQNAPNSGFWPWAPTVLFLE